MNRLRFLTAGESHGPGLTAILEGMPAGLPLSPGDLLPDMRRRQRSRGAGGRMKIEKDAVRVTAGVMAGHTTGAPIALHVDNRDWANWKEKQIPPMTVPRPGHADLTGAIKYGYRDLRLSLERASARETAARVAVGAVCKALLREFGVRVGSYVVGIGSVTARPDDPPVETAVEVYLRRFELAEENDVRCPDGAAAAEMQAHVDAAVRAGDTLGGVFEVVALGVPPGLGSHVHYDRRLDARLAAALVSIQAVKGVEIGPAFENAHLTGTKVHDEMAAGGSGEITRLSNHTGGLEGGITTGLPVVIRAAMKPIATTLEPLGSIDLASREAARTSYERSDFCAVPRAAVVGEAMVAFVLADALVEKLGGDSLDEMRPRFESLRRSDFRDLPMDNAPWRWEGS